MLIEFIFFSFPFVCDSIIYGITKDNVNNKTMSYDPVYIIATTLNETTTTYVTGAIRDHFCQNICDVINEKEHC